jgi:hypothetical protein
VLQQIGSYLGYTGRAANPVRKAARDPEPTPDSSPHIKRFCSRPRRTAAETRATFLRHAWYIRKNPVGAYTTDSIAALLSRRIAAFSRPATSRRTSSSPLFRARGVGVSEVFHRGTAKDSRLSGPDPERRSYASFVTFNDPDGNNWLVQEVTQRLPGQVSADTTTFTSSPDLAAALRRAAAAHGEHEKRTGQQDAAWPDWYADYIVREQTGQQLPS